MTYPMRIEHTDLVHGGGTKEYHLTLITTDAVSKNAMVILRYGKIGAWGTVQVMILPTARRAEDFYNKKLREKNGNGYSATKNHVINVVSDAEIARTLGERMMKEIPPADLLALDPDFEFTKSSFSEIEIPPNGAPDAPAAKIPEKEPEKTEEELKRIYAANPLFGAF